MDIICDACNAKFKIADEKLPVGKAVSLPCPKCKAKIVIQPPPPKKEIAEDEIGDFFSFTEAGTDDYNASEKPFDFVEEEGKTALLCDHDPELKKRVSEVLDILEYSITEVNSTREALKKMRYNNYDLIIVNEMFDTSDPDRNGVLIYLERLNMLTRRNIFVTLISSRHRTMDNMAAMQKSVNIIMNIANIDDFDKIIRRGIADNDLFYRLYKEALTQRQGGS